MSMESLPKEFKKTTEVLPLSTYGLSSVEEFRKAENKELHQELLKKAGLTAEELTLYQDNEAGLLDRHTKIEPSVLKSKLEEIYRKIMNFQNTSNQSTPSCSSEDKAATPTNTETVTGKLQDNPIKVFPEGHPMNHLKQIEESLFGHLNDETLPISKRRKILRHFERRKERVLAQGNLVRLEPHVCEATAKKPGSLWDLKKVPAKPENRANHEMRRRLIGPSKRPTMYTVKENRIVRLERVERNRDEFRAVDIIAPVNEAEEQLLEGTKMSLDDIMKIDRFKAYQPGVPSKVLYLKNIAPSVSLDQLSLLFKQFTLDNGGPINVRLLSGMMRGQAFVAFTKENLAIQALQEVNGTILGGRPIIAQFGRNSNRIQFEGNRRQN